MTLTRSKGCEPHFRAGTSARIATAGFMSRDYCRRLLSLTSLFMLPLMTGLARRDKPLDWLSADVPACVLFVMHLRRTRATIHTPIAVALQNQRPLALPIV
jgi:hypothetical protein